MKHKVEKISNGFILTYPHGVKQFFKDVPDIISCLGEDLHSKVIDMRHFEWSGEFTITFGFEIEGAG